MDSTVAQVTERIVRRSADTRRHYLARVARAVAEGPVRGRMGCSNLAHGMAACGAAGKSRLQDEKVPNLAIVTAYNDMLSAHAPYERFPPLIRETAAAAGAVAQVAGGVPAMCDGVTQGRAGMELSLFSRDVIAMATAVALSHDMFDAALYLGICDKIVPGLMIGALSFGHLPAVFVPAGPMPSGLPNKEKAKVREAFAAGEVDRAGLLAAEAAAYHSPGTCTFYGTANSNQMLMEFMGLQLPGGSFVNPADPMRDALTAAAVGRTLAIARDQEGFQPIGRLVDERACVNAMVGLLATGGSTNHTLHLPAIAATAGIILEWRDFADLARVTPTLAHVYPNGSADVNQFHAAGGLGFAIRELLAAGLLHEDVATIAGPGLGRYAQRPRWDGNGGLAWEAVPAASGDRSVLRPATEPFRPNGGLAVVEGPLGRGIVKVSAVADDHLAITAPARVFRSQRAFTDAFERGELDADMVLVVSHQGPAANGMPELHKLTPYLGALQNKGRRVALLTDGRMSGASGKVLAAIHISPEAAEGGWIGRIEDGDVITIDARAGTVEVAADLAARPPAELDREDSDYGTGRELFRLFRERVGPATAGATVFGSPTGGELADDRLRPTAGDGGAPTSGSRTGGDVPDGRFRAAAGGGAAMALASSAGGERA